MLDLLKSIITLITGYFTNKTVRTETENKIADVTKQAILEEVRADNNAVVVEQIIKTDALVSKVKTDFKIQNDIDNIKPLDTQLDEVFGNDE